MSPDHQVKHNYQLAFSFSPLGSACSFPLGHMMLRLKPFARIRMSWFEKLTGFSESPTSDVRRNLFVADDTLVSMANSNVMTYGRLETPTLGELREHVAAQKKDGSGRIRLREVVGDVQRLHADQSNAGAMFQVASQFNLLEMVSPSVTPEKGVGIYENDFTQGPACAIAAGAGTIYRNYFAPVNGSIGQTADNQIDCLCELGSALGNENEELWKMRNGYALASRRGLKAIAERIQSSTESEMDTLRSLLRVGLQWNTQVTLEGCSHLVTQAFCSALPVAYSRHSARSWWPFARLVLEATYEATICAAILNSEASGNHSVFLTLVGGGAFGNENNWIVDSIKRALELYRDTDLDVAIVSYGRSKRFVQELAAQFV